jgi:hypothetical protein
MLCITLCLPTVWVPRARVPNPQSSTMRRRCTPSTFCRHVVSGAAAVLIALPLVLAAVPAAEKQALVDLYTATGGASWGYSDQWLTGGVLLSNWRSWRGDGAGGGAGCVMAGPHTGYRRSLPLPRHYTHLCTSTIGGGGTARHRFVASPPLLNASRAPCVPACALYVVLEGWEGRGGIFATHPLGTHPSVAHPPTHPLHA